VPTPPVSTAIEAVLFDFGGVLSTSPFDAFERHELAQGMAVGFIRTLNATNPHDNAGPAWNATRWTSTGSANEFEAEAAAAGGRLDARALFATMAGQMRPKCSRPSAAATSTSRPAC